MISHPAEGEVVLNDAYRELAAHYSAAVLPGRVKKPKDYPEDCVLSRVVVEIALGWWCRAAIGA